MPAPAVARHLQQRWSLDHLSTELLILILEQLANIDLRSLGTTRLVSTRFNAIATPIRYHTLRMTRSIISPQADIYFPQGVANVYAHTRHVIVDSDLEAEDVKRVLNNIRGLSCISWRYVQNDHLCKGGFWVPSDILSPRHTQSNAFRLYIENLPLLDFPSEQPNPYLRAVPTGILVSLVMAAPTPPLTARVGSLKGLLLHSRRLETFWYEDRGQGTQFEFSSNERLPPFKELYLRSYDWNHSAIAVRQHWDFSNIRRLEMVDVPLNPFLNSVSFADFRHLEALRLDDSGMRLPNIQRDATRGQYLLIKQIRALAELSLTCDTQSFPVDGILQHGQCLRSLSFRDYTGFFDEHRRCPTIGAEDLDIMSRTLTNLRTLELDMDEKRCEPRHFLRAICNFRRLDTLTLHVQTVLDPLRYADTSIVDLDHERAMQILSSAAGDKLGAPWCSVTINVGGWKPIMVRRLSAPWRALNGRGVYAERCFVMERRGNGLLDVSERLPTRAS
ncbi:F-box domain-containing protein [Nemania sp. NC0429]|nr:F-box domain-containing protein [Nemania sp. NC0429]